MFADLHIHSRFSRVCSKNLNLDNLVKWAKIKGIHLLGTGDFSHPVWIQELKDNLKFNGKGFYYFETGGEKFPFIITGEISLIYTQPSKSDGGRGRRVHLVLLIPSIEVAEKINSYLDTKGRRDYDGRPIFKIPCDEFVREMRKISEDIEIIPAHIWTPYFGVFGSKSGFDSLKKAFGKEFENIHAIETGISSDPPMNWKIKDLENKSIVSFSDAHSFWPYRLGREATIFKKCESYLDLVKQLREQSFIGTIETDPAYGKYHWDGHAKCNFSCGPEKTKELEGKCPVCGKNLIVGVESRVEDLAEGENYLEVSPNLRNAGRQKMFYTLLPLHEIISLWVGVGMNSKKVWGIYNFLIEKFKTEFNILLDVSEEEMVKEEVKEKLIELILKNRKGKIKVKPGYDGKYGVALIENFEE